MLEVKVAQDRPVSESDFEEPQNTDIRMKAERA